MYFLESFVNEQDADDGLVPAAVEQAQETNERRPPTTPPPVANERGRKPGKKSTSDKVDIAAELERNRQSFQEGRTKKKSRYQYLEELVTEREKAVIALRQELDKYRMWCAEIEENRIPDGLPALLEEMAAEQLNSERVLNI